MTVETAADSDAETPTETVHVDGEADLDELVADHDVVLLEFYADWCGPCQALAPTLETLAAETDAAVAKVDVDVHQRLAQEYGVRGVPTLVLFADGAEVDRAVGALPEPQLRAAIEDHTA